MAMTSRNPATGEILRSFDTLDAEQLEQKLQLATRAFEEHRRTSMEDRARLMRRVGDILEETGQHSVAS
jgi:succinate-semialdehyde dehydrogenase / glutarate-semialdehyde dehydrogenase